MVRRVKAFRVKRLEQLTCGLFRLKDLVETMWGRKISWRLKKNEFLIELGEGKITGRVDARTHSCLLESVDCCGVGSDNAMELLVDILGICEGEFVATGFWEEDLSDFSLSLKRGKVNYIPVIE